MPEKGWMAQMMRDFEELGQLAEERKLIDIKADTAVAKLAREIEEKAAAATKIEDLFRRRTIQSEILNFRRMAF